MILGAALMYAARAFCASPSGGVTCSCVTAMRLSGLSSFHCFKRSRAACAFSGRSRTGPGRWRRRSRSAPAWPRRCCDWTSRSRSASRHLGRLEADALPRRVHRVVSITLRPLLSRYMPVWNMSADFARFCSGVGAMIQPPPARRFACTRPPAGPRTRARPSCGPWHVLAQHAGAGDQVRHAHASADVDRHAGDARHALQQELAAPSPSASPTKRRFAALLLKL
jgi:hypothetical protein